MISGIYSYGIYYSLKRAYFSDQEGGLFSPTCSGSVFGSITRARRLHLDHVQALTDIRRKNLPNHAAPDLCDDHGGMDA